jgi:hypothetical protein
MNHRLAIWILFALFIVFHGLFLFTVPGLMGDEASEGENVYELVQADRIVVAGERSYIGPLIDYVRLPFVWALGYTTAAVRVPMFLFSVATFWLAWVLMKRVFGEETALTALACLVFSPIWWTQQRLGWAISLFPFWLFLIIYLCLKNQFLLVGLTAGLGTANHILFLPTLLGTGVLLVARNILKWRRLLAAWPVLIGFWAGFAMQFVVLLLQKDDQGNIEVATSLFQERILDFPHLFPLLVSGSSYMASYTGVELSSIAALSITICVSVLALCSLLMVKRSPVIISVWVGLITYTVSILYMIDRFSLRYFVMGVLVVWVLAGVGLSELVRLLPAWRIKSWTPFAVAIGLIVWTAVAVIIPYLQTGGSTASFSLGNRTDSAAALVDIRPLITCLEGKQRVFSENIHIWNRLQYLSHSNSNVSILPEEEKQQAEVLVQYRIGEDNEQIRTGELCPELTHFRVLGME